MVNSHLRQALGLCAVFFALLGLAYPLVLTGIGQTLFHGQASGSLSANGSALVGQTWTGPRWFHGRPDADDPMATGGTNLGPRSKVLVSTVRKQLRVLAAEGITPTVDLATTSGSGVDPDISPADAYAQVGIIAQARSRPAAQIRRLIASHIQNPQLGFLGSAYINVLQLNEALARLR
jgi:potassium-transporting ATPase KdpC subunit